MNEIWKPVVGFEVEYEVSNLGQVRSLDREIVLSDHRRRVFPGKTLRPWTNASGHLVVGLSRGARRKVHTLVLTAFVGPRSEGMEACHGPTGPGDNRLSNLRWDTRAENQRDRVRHGTHYLARRTHCNLGHELVVPNLVRSDIRRGRGRSCLACSRAKSHVRHHPGAVFAIEASRYYRQIINQGGLPG